MTAPAVGEPLENLLRGFAHRLGVALGLDPATARLEVRILAAHALQRDRTWLIAHGREPLSPSDAERVEALVGRRLQGEPVAYILRRREFFGLDLLVTPAVLIPRPDTELLVQLALDRCPADAAVDILDLGTGSGAVALALAAQRPQARLLAVDRSAAALAVARQNAERLGLGNVGFLESDWYAGIGVKKFDMIVANPPYIAPRDPHLGQGDLRFEPREALESASDGLADIGAIVTGAGDRLKPGGWLLFEHGYDQSAPCQALLVVAGLAEVQTWTDLAGQPRVSGGCRGC